MNKNTSIIIIVIIVLAIIGAIIYMNKPKADTSGTATDTASTTGDTALATSSDTTAQGTTVANTNTPTAAQDPLATYKSMSAEINAAVTFDQTLAVWQKYNDASSSAQFVALYKNADQTKKDNLVNFSKYSFPPFNTLSSVSQATKGNKAAVLAYTPHKDRIVANFVLENGVWKFDTVDYAIYTTGPAPTVKVNQ